MRKVFTCLGLVTFLNVSPATGQTPDAPDRAALVQLADPKVYSLQLTEIIRIVEEQYVTPVSRAKLAAAALRGMYTQAGVEIPPNLLADAEKAAGDPTAFLHFILKAREKLGTREQLREDKAMIASLKALLQSLDPYSDVVRGDTSRKLRQVRAERGFGLELVQTAEADGLLVKAVALGGPAQQAGLRPNDRITRIDGERLTKGQSEPQAFLQEEQIHLTVYRPSAKENFQATLRQQNFTGETVLGVVRRTDNTWQYLLDPERRIAYVRLTSLEAESSEQFMDVVEQLRDAGMRGLLLDLRWCPGGFLDEARVVAESFLGEYSLGYFMFPSPVNWVARADLFLDNHCSNAVVRYRPEPGTHEARVDHQTKHAPKSFVGFPVVVLINGQTTGGAELIAAVLQDNRRAFIFGQRTRGKGSVQTFVELGEGGAHLSVPLPNTRLKLTNGFLVRPSGRNLHRFPDSKPADDWGVRPDAGLEFRMSAELSNQLRDWYEFIGLRPASCDESVPLDDPHADPQRLAALKLLQKVVK